MYDQYGEEALGGGGGGGHSHGGFGGFGGFDPFSMFFGGGGGGGGGGRRQQSRGPRKGEDCQLGLRVTLEELYNGASKTLGLKKKVICTACKK